MKLSLLLEGTVNEDISEMDINNVCYDPQNCGNGDLLFLLNDRAKNKYITHPKEVAAIVTESPLTCNSGARMYTTSNIRAALSIACARMYCKDLSKIKFIGVTGTNGKSTTAIMLENILADFGYKVGYIGTGIIRAEGKILSDKYYSMTTPPPDILYRAISNMEVMGVEMVVMEVSSHALDQERVAPISFEIGMFTNLSEEHLDYHKSITEYFKAKKRLIEKSKYAIVNSDDTYGRLILTEYENIEGCGKDFYKATRISDIKSIGFSGNKFHYRSDINDSDISIRLPGDYNVYNAMLAIRAAEKLGIPMEAIKDSLKKIEKIKGRFNIINEKITVVIDYAHTVSAFTNLIKNLNYVKNARQNLCVVFGCGGERDKGKRGRMGEIAEEYADQVILTSDNPRGEDPLAIIEDIMKSMKKKPTIIVDRRSAIRHAILSANDGDIVAIIGKGPECYSILNGVYSPFNESEIIREALEERPK